MGYEFDIGSGIGFGTGPTRVDIEYRKKYWPNKKVLYVCNLGCNNKKIFNYK